MNHSTKSRTVRKTYVQVRSATSPTLFLFIAQHHPSINNFISFSNDGSCLTSFTVRKQETSLHPSFMTKALSNGTGRSFWLSSLTIFLQFFTACLGFQAKSTAFQIQQTEFLTQLSVASIGTHENMSQETSSTVPLRKFLIHWK